MPALSVNYHLAEDVTAVSACAATCDVDKLQCRPKSLQTACRLQYTDVRLDRHSQLQALDMALMTGTDSAVGWESA